MKDIISKAILMKQIKQAHQMKKIKSMNEKDLYEEYEEKEIFEELNDIKRRIENLKDGMEESSQTEVGEEKKESYSSGKHDYMIKSMISKYNNIHIPDIREELQLINEMMNEDGLSEEELEILHEEYQEKIQILADALQEKRNSVERMFNLFKNLKF
ncbi:hypothetical protein [Oceanirhabdus sp. W0125-5]|uniref:hypothetical protein n=1 Tax=Oceanirhabdus sp. W0125-5 TaxID=2999116 RepID=UPI0022F32BE9|nr:hypothetical protein [Oceanirhabdus sp. W0125-5]WBW97375.1 hypothetical protein OW730_00545 [Oceanirhabdus sp. W0125-5]